ncbi:MAG: hypothetical protein Q8O00_14725 [Holophaga sp.]|nr:hypothetical protein [Holophaga sp.]
MLHIPINATMPTSIEEAHERFCGMVEGTIYDPVGVAHASLWYANQAERFGLIQTASVYRNLAKKVPRAHSRERRRL